MRAPKVVSYGQMYRSMLVDKMDLEVNACSTEASVDQISLDTTAQVKKFD